jgi:hypothetical protein
MALSMKWADRQRRAEDRKKIAALERDLYAAREEMGAHMTNYGRLAEEHRVVTMREQIGNAMLNDYQREQVDLALARALGGGK